MRASMSVALAFTLLALGSARAVLAADPRTSTPLPLNPMKDAKVGDWEVLVAKLPSPMDPNKQTILVSTFTVTGIDGDKVSIGTKAESVLRSAPPDTVTLPRSAPTLEDLENLVFRRQKRLVTKDLAVSDGTRNLDGRDLPVKTLHYNMWEPGSDFAGEVTLELSREVRGLGIASMTCVAPVGTLELVLTAYGNGATVEWGKMPAAIVLGHLPLNTYEKAQPGDWSVLATTRKMAGGAGEPTVVAWTLSAGQGGKLEEEVRYGTSKGSREVDPGKTPTLDEFYPCRDDAVFLIDPAQEDADLTIAGHVFHCQKVHLGRQGQHMIMDYTVWLCPEVRGSGIVAFKETATLDGQATVTEGQLVGFGTKDGATWGKTIEDATKTEGK